MEDKIWKTGILAAGKTCKAVFWPGTKEGTSDSWNLISKDFRFCICSVPQTGTFLTVDMYYVQLHSLQLINKNGYLPQESVCPYS